MKLILDGTRYLVLLALLLCLTQFSSALTYCATDAFTASCGKCAFDSSGKISENCYKGYQAKGAACVGVTYPGIAFQYPLGGCPAFQNCVDSLTSCSDFRCTGTDQGKCYDPFCRSCYEEADRCAERASKDCSAAAECGDGKCEADKGETSDNCCKDCKCMTGMECKDNKCVVKNTGSCTPTELYITCVTDMSQEECVGRAKVLYLTEKEYKSLELVCCQRPTPDRGLNCYFIGEKRDTMENLAEDAEDFIIDICMGGPLILPIAMLSALVAGWLPDLARKLL
ncbi:MAG: hypothetical protein NTU61_02655 [Candidatus Altiarchaeota archaeon]|nr:hypothetical protein [Candidatus Altiarchaeota archaeon]